MIEVIYAQMKTIRVITKRALRIRQHKNLHHEIKRNSALVLGMGIGICLFLHWEKWDFGRWDWDLYHKKAKMGMGLVLC